MVQALDCSYVTRAYTKGDIHLDRLITLPRGGNVTSKSTLNHAWVLDMQGAKKEMRRHEAIMS